MTLADKLTFFRISLTPIFFIFYQLPVWAPSWFKNGSVWTVPVIWLIYVISEVTDLLDGFAARKLNETSDLGKLLDPFADTLMQITCFLCFVLDGIFPAFLFLLVVYREFGILLIRNLMLKKGISMGARISGKLKTSFYVAAGGFALLAMGIQRSEFFTFILDYVIIAANIVFAISVLISIVSFIDYLLFYKKTAENTHI